MKKRLAKIIKGVLQFICVIGFIMALVLSASATSIPVTNYSFEVPALGDGGYIFSIPGWEINGYTDEYFSAGVWNPRADQSSQDFINGIPDGNQVGWSNGGDIIQYLSATLTEGYRYTLTVWIGGRPIYSGKHYAVILAGEADLNSQTGVNIENEWNKVTVTYTAQPRDSNAGQQLAIKLMNYDTIQLNFDMVSLDESLVLTCQGFLPPFDKPLTLKAKNKWAIPVKMVLRDLASVLSVTVLYTF
jgi:hypothetical protein